jgi:hypothetical protein
MTIFETPLHSVDELNVRILFGEQHGLGVAGVQGSSTGFFRVLPTGL